jgi:hypothetical protein
MVKISIDSCSKFGLIGLIIKLEYLSVVLAVIGSSSVRAVPIVGLTVNHLYLVIEKSHSLDLIFKLELHVGLLELSCLS